MEISTRFSPGDKAWGWNNEKVCELTIGEVRVRVTKSPGIPGHFAENYSAQEKREEQYMCVETGVGSGTLYTLNEHIFATKEECETALSDLIAKLEAEKMEREEKRRQSLIAEEKYLRKQLSNIEKLKAESRPAANT